MWLWPLLLTLLLLSGVLSFSVLGYVLARVFMGRRMRAAKAQLKDECGGDAGRRPRTRNGEEQSSSQDNG